MTDRIQDIKNFFWEKKHHIYRSEEVPYFAEDFAARNLSLTERVSEHFVKRLALERAVVFPFEKIALTRTIRQKEPVLFTEEEMTARKMRYPRYHHMTCSNVNPGYEEVIANGLEYYRQKAVDKLKHNELVAKPFDGYKASTLPLEVAKADSEDQVNLLTKEQQAFYAAVIADIEAIYDLTDRYRIEAEKQGNTIVAGLFSKLPRLGATTFHEALQMFRILHFMLWIEGEVHNTIGRFDQYMYPYFQQDIDRGELSEEKAFELLEEFFLTLNRDSDLYPGIMEGDNGQSMVLGGMDQDGNPCFNRLSELCLKASKELKLIDPKINLRVSKDTPFWVYELGTELTKEGLGFPQYCNDDVVVPGLTMLGYDLVDARNYVVAACWEFTIPRWGMEIPNINAMNFPKVIDRCFRRDLVNVKSFDDFLDCVTKEIEVESADLLKETDDFELLPAPYMSLFMDNCIETGKDICYGSKYNNFGFHGVGISTAADSLAAIRQLVFEEKSLTAAEFVEAVEADYGGYEDLLVKLREQMPKMGDNDDRIDELAVRIMDDFADSLRDKRNQFGGIIRPGTGSAMFYLNVEELGASPDGRRAGEPYGANYAPSLFANLSGPLSMIQSFVKPNLIKTINGGPLTMEFHETLFRDNESIQKVASLVSFFIEKGGHQMQLNTLNRESLLDAQKNPEKYANLIVRVWGWSAYFVRLDKEYQDHIMSRQAYV